MPGRRRLVVLRVPAAFLVMTVGLLLSLPTTEARGRRQKLVEDVDEEDGSVGWSAGKRKQIEEASAAEARERQRREARGLKPLPLFPTHATVCDGRPCRPGEGNMKGYQMWFQPYEHREAYVQSRSRRMPHWPDEAHYADAIREGRRVQTDGLVLMTAGDWDYRELVLNWVMHCHKHKLSNALVLSMERELHDELLRRRIPSVDNAANLQKWNGTCLQRHIQAVRTERHLAVAAMVGAGLEVLLCDATALLVGDPVLLPLP